MPRTQTFSGRARSAFSRPVRPTLHRGVWLTPVASAGKKPSGEVEHRPMTASEERANCLSHGVGTVAAIVAAPGLLGSVLDRGDPVALAGVSLFALFTVILYACSAIMHGYPEGRTKKWLEVADHAVIFLMIAGTYTPLSLVVLGGGVGLGLLAAVWVVAVYGFARTVAAGIERPYRAGLLYVAMGWMAVLVAPALIERMPGPGLLLIVAGGLAYSGGYWFYQARWMRYHHLVWHTMVMLGTALHYAAIWLYAA